MPYSSIVGKSLLVLAVNRLAARMSIPQVIDVGAGLGTYAHLLKPILPRAKYVGLEIWAPYVKDYRLAEVYDQVHVADARVFDYSLLDKGGIALLGDVLEHMPRADAQGVVFKLLSACDVVFISLPIGDFPQGELMGNPWETHVESWAVEHVRDTFPLVAGEALIQLAADEGLGIFALAKDKAVRDAARTCMVESGQIVMNNQSLVFAGLDALPAYHDPAVIRTFHEALRPHLV